MRRDEAEALVGALSAAKLRELERLEPRVVEGFHPWARQKPLLAVFRSQQEPEPEPLHLLVMSWNPGRPELYHLIVFGKTTAGPLLGAHEVRDGRLRWSLGALPGDPETSAERRRRFVELFGSSEIALPLPRDAEGAPAFLDELHRALRARRAAEALPDRKRAEEVAGWLLRIDPGLDLPALRQRGELSLDLQPGAAAIHGDMSAFLLAPGRGLLGRGAVTGAERASSGTPKRAATVRVHLRVQQLLEEPVPEGSLREHPQLGEALLRRLNRESAPLRARESRALAQLAAGRPPPRAVKIAPCEDGRYWDDCLEHGYVCVGWDEVGDLRQYPTAEAFHQAFASQFAYGGAEAALGKKAAELWTLAELRPGDLVVANRGAAEVLAVGEVQEPGYEWRPERPACRHTVRVTWDTSAARPVPRQTQWVGLSVAAVPVELFRAIIERPSLDEPGAELSALHALRAALEEDELHFSEEALSAFLLALQVTRLVVLTGVSGIGKTRLCRSLARWFGAGERESPEQARSLLLSVRPGWDESTPLFGHYDQARREYVQSDLLRLLRRAKLDGELAAEAGRAAQPFFVILDGMNLARNDGYLSDLLSSLDSGAPIPLHEDEQLAAGVRRAAPVPRLLTIPDNVFFVGTFNADQGGRSPGARLTGTALILELSPLDLRGFGCTGIQGEQAAEARLRLLGFPGQLAPARRAGPEDWQKLGALQGGELRRRLVDVHEILEGHQRQFGFRVANEVGRFVALALEQGAPGGPSLRAALDVAILSRVLPGLRGGREEISSLIGRLFAYAAGGDLLTALEERDPFRGFRLERELSAEAGAAHPAPLLPRTAAKLFRMAARLRAGGPVPPID